MLRKMLWVAAAVLGGAVVGLLATPATRTAYAAAAIEATVLFDFENDDDVKAWGVEDDIKDKVALAASAEHATSGKRSLAMTLKPHEWPGMNTTKLPKDWSGYSDLAFDVWAGADSSLCIRIDDEASKDYGSRYNSPAQDVSKGANTVTIPVTDVGDAIDLKKIKAMYLFSTNVPEDITFFIDNIRLIKKK